MTYRASRLPVSLIAILSIATAQSAAAQVFINEIHYDNTGTDTGEAIEIAGAAGTDLTGWTIVLYNGSGGAAYGTEALSGVLTNQQGGLGTTVVNYPSNGLQNGSPDGIALVDDTGSVVQFLSYEGSFTAVGGAADGLVSTDIGVAEDSSTAVGDSLQLTGTGSAYADFTWAAPQPNTFCAVNTGQTFGDGSPGDGIDPCATGGGGDGEPSDAPLVINEIDYDQPGTDTAEFIEIENVSAVDVALAGVTVQLINGSNGTTYATFVLPDATLAPGAFFVICANPASTPHCDLDASPDTNLIQNGSPDAAEILRDGAVIDAVSYEGDVAGVVEGSGAGLEDPGSIPFVSISRYPDGVDTDRNNIDLSLRCATPGEPNSDATSGCSNPAPPVGPYEIYEIQGAGDASPFADQNVITDGNVVTAVGADGFTMQTPDERADADVNTSNGIFVFTGSTPTVSVGDLVNVTGAVTEYFGFTEFSGNPAVTITSAGLPLPTPVVFDADTPSPDPASPSCSIEYECYEGMYVVVPDGTVTGPNQYFSSDPIAEAFITAAPARTFREPGLEYPGMTGLPVWDGNPEVFELDPDRMGLANRIIPAGSSFSAAGVLGFEFGGYELWPTSLSVAEKTIPDPVRRRHLFETTVGSLNLYRLFDDVDDPPGTNAMGEPTDDTVVSTAEYQRRLQKFARYIVEDMRAPDILGVQEVESQKVLEDLAAAINAIDPRVRYDATVVEGNDIGGIDVGFLVRRWRVWVFSIEQLGADETYVNPEDGLPDLLHDRPPLLLRGWAGFTPLNVMVVHNRSLSGIETERVQAKRLAQAESIAQKVQDIQGRRGQGKLIVVGDFNAYEFSDGYVDAVGTIRGDFDPSESLLSGDDLVDPNLMDQVLSLPAAERYSFVFDGNAQVLDHALTTRSLDFRFRGMQYARGDADAAEGLINDDTTPLRSSDHDGLVLYIYTGPGWF